MYNNKKENSELLKLNNNYLKSLNINKELRKKNINLVKEKQKMVKIIAKKNRNECYLC